MAIDRADWHWETAEQEFREKNGVTGEEDYICLKKKMDAAYENFLKIDDFDDIHDPCLRFQK